jgi:hypothetical protein
MIPHDQISEEEPWYAFPYTSISCVEVHRLEKTYSDDLGRGVMRRTATCLEHTFTCFPCGHTKVGDLDVLVLVKKQVLGLQVSVTDIESVTVVDGVDDLLEVMQSLRDR